MSKNKIFIPVTICILLLAGIVVFAKQNKDDDRFVIYIANPKKQEISFYLKDEKHTNFNSIGHLKTWLAKKHQHLLFAMNGGMYKPDHSPQGIYIEKGITISPTDTTTGDGNFYLKPNGVFFISKDNILGICTTENFINNGNIQYATQSGPMLVIDGSIHPGFKQGSLNLNIRNGVGILPDNTILFAMSKKGINFYDFASYFKNMGCKNALYLDGLVSRTYLPEKSWLQMDGDFGVIIGISIAKE